jgi:hypothetical protein
MATTANGFGGAPKTFPSVHATYANTRICPRREGGGSPRVYFDTFEGERGNGHIQQTASPHS